MSLPGIAHRAVTLALVTTPLLAALQAQADGPSVEAATPGSASASAAGSTSVSASASAPVVAASTSTPAPKATVETTTGPVEPPEPVKAVESDHALVVGHFGFGYFGQYDAAIGVIRTAGNSTPIQMVGVRRWFSRVRLDLAIGLGLSSGSSSTSLNGGETVSTDDASLLAFGARVALPVALWVDRHYTVFAGPEIVYAHAGETIPAPKPTAGATPLADTTHEGDRFTLGVRAGAEIQFGFIGLPRLALDASLGIAVDYASTKSAGSSVTTPTPGVPSGGVFVRKQSRTSVASSTSHQPWNIFITNVAAVYYF